MQYSWFLHFMPHIKRDNRKLTVSSPRLGGLNRDLPGVPWLLSYEFFPSQEGLSLPGVFAWRWRGERSMLCSDPVLCLEGLLRLSAEPTPWPRWEESPPPWRAGESVNCLGSPSSLLFCNSCVVLTDPFPDGSSEWTLGFEWGRSAEETMSEFSLVSFGLIIFEPDWPFWALSEWAVSKTLSSLSWLPNFGTLECCCQIETLKRSYQLTDKSLKC